MSKIRTDADGSSSLKKSNFFDILKATVINTWSSIPEIK